MFNIDAIMHRRKRNGTQILWVRRYSCIENAMRRATEILMVDGCVGDLIEFTLRTNGLQVGTIRMHAAGNISIQWNYRKILRELGRGKEVKEKIRAGAVAEAFLASQSKQAGDSLH